MKPLPQLDELAGWLGDELNPLGHPDELSGLDDELIGLLDDFDWLSDGGLADRLRLFDSGLDKLSHVTRHRAHGYPST